MDAEEVAGRAEEEAAGPTFDPVDSLAGPVLVLLLGRVERFARIGELEEEGARALFGLGVGVAVVVLAVAGRYDGHRKVPALAVLYPIQRLLPPTIV